MKTETLLVLAVAGVAVFFIAKQAGGAAPAQQPMQQAPAQSSFWSFAESTGSSLLGAIFNANQRDTSGQGMAWA